MNPSDSNLSEPTHDVSDVLLRCGVFAAVVILARFVVSILFTLAPGTEVVTLSAVTSFCAGAAANISASRWFGSGKLSDFGMGWSMGWWGGTARHLAIGLALGITAVAAIVFGSVAAGFASLESAPSGGALPLTLWLTLAVIGEELVFRGFLFQYLTRQWGPVASVALTGLVFGAAHLISNSDIHLLGVLNTALWGSLLGFACFRAGSLWLPIGLHLGWNLALVGFGADLSGFTMGAAGLRLHWSASELWSGGSYGPEGGLSATLAAVAVFAVLRRVR